MNDPCPLHHADITRTPENPERWAPPSAVVGACFQLHDQALVLYRVAHTIDKTATNVRYALENIKLTVRFIEDQLTP